MPIPKPIKYIANYIKRRKQYTLYNNNNKSILRSRKTGVPQRGVLSPTLFNMYTADLLTPTSPNITTVTYADDTTILSSHPNPHIAQQVQPYLQKIYDWTKQNQLTLNASKTTTTLFTPDPTEYNTTLTLQINNTTLPTNKEPKILGLTPDPKLTYSKHIQNTTQKAKQTIHIMKALTTTHWRKSKIT